MKSLILRSTAALLLVALSGCGKKEAAEKPAVEAKTKHEENVVTLTKENLARVAVKNEIVARGSLDMTLKAVGRIGENLNKTAKVRATFEGRLTKLNFDLNQSVKAGDVMGLVETPELLGKSLELKAPIEGHITERKSTVGELIGKETEVYTISDPTDLWVLAEVKERDIAAVQLGQEASFTALAYPGETFHGNVVLLGNRIETESRTLEVRIEVNNADGRLKPGMFADVEIATTAVKDVLVISDQALQTLEDEQIVFVALSETKFEKRVVKTGLEQHGRVQIVEGIKEGEHVVTEGSFILKSELLKGDLGEE
ncbi:MAG TPA: efflux RND transporter periplasmic adaptor subunit [Opitutaceae bacterium]|nr:efflux RND transporter periplasmic adaptor subunit [Lacunisphaera sp.]HWA09153.1 efflux RND transporter periplasmic adaptor subunit [Opitutaceae bacterium]